MIVTLEISAESQKVIADHERLAARAPEAMARSLETAAYTGSEDIRMRLTRGELGLTMRHPGSGLAASVSGWMLDETMPLAAVGVPSNSPAASYAMMLERGGTIRPRRAKALAVPVSDEARQYTSPRDMRNLTLIPRKGRPGLLVEKHEGGRKAAHWIIHWVLVGSVRIAPRRWLSRGIASAGPAMAAAFEDRLNEYVQEW